MLKIENKEIGNLRFVYLNHNGYPFEHERMSKQVDQYIADMELKQYGSRMIMIFNPPEAAPIEQWSTAIGRGVIGFVETSGDYEVRNFSGLTSLGMEHDGTIEELARSYDRLKERAAEDGQGVQSFWRILFKRSKGAEGTIIPKTLVQLFVGKCS